MDSRGLKLMYADAMIAYEDLAQAYRKQAEENTLLKQEVEELKKPKKAKNATKSIPAKS